MKPQTNNLLIDGLTLGTEQRTHDHIRIQHDGTQSLRRAIACSFVLPSLAYQFYRIFFPVFTTTGFTLELTEQSLHHDKWPNTPATPAARAVAGLRRCSCAACSNCSHSCELSLTSLAAFISFIVVNFHSPAKQAVSSQISPLFSLCINLGEVGTSYSRLTDSDFTKRKTKQLLK